MVVRGSKGVAQTFLSVKSWRRACGKYRQECLCHGDRKGVLAGDGAGEEAPRSWLGRRASQPSAKSGDVLFAGVEALGVGSGGRCECFPGADGREFGQGPGSIRAGYGLPIHGEILAGFPDTRSRVARTRFPSGRPCEWHPSSDGRAFRPGSRSARQGPPAPLPAEDSGG